MNFIIWSPIHLVYVGMYRYVPVRTGTYRLVLLWCTTRYVLLVNFRMSVHTCTYRYVLVRQMTKSTYAHVRVRTFGTKLAVHGSTWQYMAVYGSTRQYMMVHFLLRTDSMLVRTGMSEYKLHGCPAAFCARNVALLKALISRIVQAETPMHEQTDLFTSYC
jgi:hypothetical protein